MYVLQRRRVVPAVGTVGDDDNYYCVPPPVIVSAVNDRNAILVFHRAAGVILVHAVITRSAGERWEASATETDFYGPDRPSCVWRVIVVVDDTGPTEIRDVGIRTSATIIDFDRPDWIIDERARVFKRRTKIEYQNEKRVLVLHVSFTVYRLIRALVC